MKVKCSRAEYLPPGQAFKNGKDVKYFRMSSKHPENAMKIFLLRLLCNFSVSRSVGQVLWRFKRNWWFMLNRRIWLVPYHRCIIWSNTFTRALPSRGEQYNYFCRNIAKFLLLRLKLSTETLFINGLFEFKLAALRLKIRLLFHYQLMIDNNNFFIQGSV